MPKKQKNEIVVTLEKNEKPIKKSTRKTKLKDEKEPKIHLKKGVYNIDYVLSLCKQILSMVNALLLQPQHLQFTLKNTLQKMIHDLEFEKAEMHDPRPKLVLMTCNVCKATAFCYAKQMDKWKCSHC